LDNHLLDKRNIINKKEYLSMIKVKLVLLLVLAVALAVLVIQNRAPIHMRFLWLSAEVSSGVLLFLTVTGGFILGLLAALLIKSSGKSKS